MSPKSRIEELQAEVDQENAEQQDAEDTPQSAQAPAPVIATISPDALANAIVKATEFASGRVRKVPYGQQRIRSPFNPTGNRHRTLNRRIYQNGFSLNIKLLHDAEIDLLNSGKIVPGRYLDKLITVRVEDEEDGTSAMHFDYRNRTADQRMALGMRLGAGGGATGFESLLRLILKEIDQRKADEKTKRKLEVEEALA